MRSVNEARSRNTGNTVVWSLLLVGVTFLAVNTFRPDTGESLRLALASLSEAQSTLPQQVPAVAEKQELPDFYPKTPLEWIRMNPLGIPPGQAQNLPSIRVEDENLNKVRSIYGGKNDAKHLGGFTELDIHGISPTVWSNVITKYGVRSFIDVGCGKGVSTLWMLEHGVDVLCVEGSHDAVTQSLLPPERVVEHDFSRGPWWPGKTYDMAWSVEFTEHVSRQYHFNYVTTLRKAALIFITSSQWGGWHHTEVHPNSWWIRKFESYGFRYDDELTKEAKEWAMAESRNATVLAPNGKRFGAQHLITSLKVFVNPAVAALPEHAHLFPRDGCFERYAEGEQKKIFMSVTRPCGTGKEGHLETALPDSFNPLPLSPEMHQRWNDKVVQSITK